MISNSIRFAAIGGAFFLAMVVLPANTLFGQSGKPLAFEVAILKVTPEVASQMFATATEDSKFATGTEKVSSGIPIILNDSVSVTNTTQYEGEVRSCRVGFEEYNELLNRFVQPNGLSVTVGPGTVLSEDGKATGFSGEARAFCVSSEVRRARFGTVVNVPRYHVIEDGIIVQHQASKDAHGQINLNSTLVINYVDQVDNFTLQGATRPVTLQLPTTRTRQLEIQTTLERDQVLMVASDYPNDSGEQELERGVPFTSNMPYVNRLFKNVGIGRQATVLIYVISARR